MMMKMEGGRVNRREMEEMKKPPQRSDLLIEFRQLGESIRLCWNWTVPRHKRLAVPECPREYRRLQSN
jgi:hypothetical protein